MRAYYQRDPDSFDLRVWNESSQLLERDLMQISIVGPDGYVRSSTNPGWNRVWVGDRDHFRALVDAHDDKMVISKPVIGRISHRPAIQLVNLPTADVIIRAVHVRRIAHRILQRRFLPIAHVRWLSRRMFVSRTSGNEPQMNTDTHG